MIGAIFNVIVFVFFSVRANHIGMLNIMNIARKDHVTILDSLLLP